MRAMIAGFVFLAALTFAPMSWAQDWQAAFDEWAQTHPQAAREYEKAKKQAEQNEKDLKKISDRAFQSSFDNVFGSNNFKPSEAIDLIKAVEAVSYGDYQAAGEASGGLVISKFAPGLGQYIELMKVAAKGIKIAEQAWIEGLYETRACKNSVELLDREPKTGPNAYIPSYMLMYLKNNQTFGSKITPIYHSMQAREAAMFDAWMNDEGAVDQMLLGGWAGRWRSAMGKVPTERQMFNYFLHKNTSSDRARYMERFQRYYLEPMIDEQVRQQKRKYNTAMRNALSSVVRATGGTSKECQDMKQRLAEITTTFNEQFPKLIDQMDSVLTRAEAALPQEKERAIAARNAHTKAYTDESEELSQERAEIRKRKAKQEEVWERRDTWQENIEYNRARLLASKDEPGYSDRVETFNEDVRAFNAYKYRIETASDNLSDRIDAFNKRLEDRKKGLRC